MNRNLIAIAAASAAVAIPIGVATADEPKAPAAPAEVIAYNDSGEWDDDTAAVVAKAKKSLASQLKKRPKKPGDRLRHRRHARSRPMSARRRADFERGAITTCQLNTDQDPITETKALYKYAVKKKVAVYFITGRPGSIREGTAAQLKRDGFGKGTLLMTPTDKFGQGSSSAQKIAHRKAIEKDGFTILINIGDQKSDLVRRLLGQDATSCRTRCTSPADRAPCGRPVTDVSFRKAVQGRCETNCQQIESFWTEGVDCHGRKTRRGVAVPS